MTTTPSAIPGTPKPGFTSEEDGIVSGYRPVSRLAIVSLFLGLLSPAALLHPLLWILPVLAVLAAGIAFRHTASPSAEVRGRSFALTAIGLGCLFGSLAMVWSFSFEWAVERQARQYGIAWLETVREGRLKEAHQLTLNPGERLPPDVSLADAYAPPQANSAKPGFATTTAADMEGGDAETFMTESLAQRFAQFFGQQPLAKLVALGRTWSARYRTSLSHMRLDQYSRNVAEVFEISYEDRGQPQTMEVVIVVQRTRIGRIADWRITSVTDRQSIR